MKQKGFQKFISVLLALVLTLGLALPAMAADGSGEQGSKLSFEQVSADEYNVGLSRRDEVPCTRIRTSFEYPSFWRTPPPWKRASLPTRSPLSAAMPWPIVSP